MFVRTSIVIDELKHFQNFYAPSLKINNQDPHASNLGQRVYEIENFAYYFIPNFENGLQNFQKRVFF